MKKKELLTSTLTSYFKNKKLDRYAILLNGEWGSGKTYFWKEFAKSSLEDVPVVYVSLFSITTIEELKSKILTAYISETKGSEGRDNWGKKVVGWIGDLLKHNKNSIAKALGALAKKHLELDLSDILEKIQISIDPLSLLPQEINICFDDLERSKLEYEDILGICDYLLDQKSANLILIGAEDSMGKKKESYEKFKEKVIRYTYKIESSFSEVYDSLSFSDEEQAKKLLLAAWKSVILEVFEITETKNLRTLRKVLQSTLSFLEIDDTANIPDADISLLTYLTIADSYSPIGQKFRPFAPRKIGKPEEIPDENPYKKIIDSLEKSSIVISNKNLIFNYVRDGIIDTDNFKSEYFPVLVKPSETYEILRHLNANPWWSQTAEEAQKNLDKIIKLFLNSKIEESPQLIAKLYLLGLEISQKLGDLDYEIKFEEIALTQMIENLDRSSIIPLEMSSTDPNRIKIEKLFSQCNERKKELDLNKSKSKILLHLEQHLVGQLDLNSTDDFLALCSLINDKVFLTNLAVEIKSPDRFTTFSFSALRCLKTYRHEPESSKALTDFGEFLIDLKSKATKKFDISRYDHILEFKAN